MGSSYRQDLRRGYGPKMWQENLREAARLLHEVERDINPYDTGQFDNAASDGGLRERLRICRTLIEDELPDEGEADD